MDTLSLGIRLAVVLPTVLFMSSLVLRYGIRTRTRIETLNYFKTLTLPKGIFTREFRLEFFIESALLSIANGAILAFSLARAEYGFILLVFGVILCFIGFVATEVESKSASIVVGTVISLLFLMFISELAYFFVFGYAVTLFGFTLLPRDIFFIPSIVLVIVLFIAAVAFRFSKKRKMQTKKETISKC